jgi:hypothetical protein
MATITLSKIEKAMLQTLAKKRRGIKARELVDTLASKGFSEGEVQRAMQRGLDSGDFELGPELQFQAHFADAQMAPKRPVRATLRRLKR